MKEILMTIHTTAEGESAVTVSAKFADHGSAVRFHEGLAELVKDHSVDGHLLTSRWKLLGSGS